MVPIIIIIVCVGLIGFYIYFNRNPERSIPQHAKIVSPADGKILEIKKLGKTVNFKKGLGFTSFATGITLPATMVRIFLNLMDVHYQRSPVAGTIHSIKHYPGKFLPAYRPDAWKNERAEIMIQSKQGMIKVVLVAGILARRCRPLVKQGQKVEKGELISRILLGSQVCVLFPECNVKVKRGDCVKSGNSFIA